MISIKKAILIIVVFLSIAICWHYIKPIVIAYRWAHLGQSCELEKVSAGMKSASMTDEEKTTTAFNFWNCVESQQSFIEKLFIPVPRNM